MEEVDVSRVLRVVQTVSDVASNAATSVSLSGKVARRRGDHITGASFLVIGAALATQANTVRLVIIPVPQIEPHRRIGVEVLEYAGFGEEGRQELDAGSTFFLTLAPAKEGRNIMKIQGNRK